jgi:hypothetical protein
MSYPRGELVTADFDPETGNWASIERGTGISDIVACTVHRPAPASTSLHQPSPALILSLLTESGRMLGQDEIE